MGLSKREIKFFGDFTRRAAIDAGQLLKSLSGKLHRIDYKGRVNLVTEADLASEALVVGLIREQFPKHDVLAEEKTSVENGSDFKWIIDPLDGTTNYAHGFPVYCVSLALEYKGRVAVGVVYNPVLDELFHAVKGGGAFLNRNKIHVSSERKLERALLATGFPYDIATSRDNNLDYFRRFAPRVRGIRRAGSAALDLCYLACGRFDGFWELKLSPWDSAAAALMVTEAGGKVTDFKGRKYSIYDKYLLATNGDIHRQMIRVLGGK